MRAFVIALALGLASAAGASAATSTTLGSGTSDVQYLDGTSWVSASPTGNDRYSTIAGTTWVAGTQGAADTFRVAFTLPAVYVGASISGQYYSDNWASAAVNGVVAATQPIGDLSANYGNPAGTPPTPFVSTALHPGVNYLTFDEGNAGGPAGIDFAATVTYTALESASQCKKGGWQDFGVFKNQGDCVSYVATGGSNPPANG